MSKSFCRYQKNMQRLSAISKDRMLSPVEEGIWWVEHVLRHNGARHLRPATLDIHWSQYSMLDIIVFIGTVVSILIFVTYKLLLVILGFIRKQLKTKTQ